MAKKSLKCPKCERRFSMPAHLARHETTIHRSKAGRKVTAKRGPKVRAKGRVGRPKGSGKKKVRRTGARAVATGLSAGAGMVRLAADMRAHHGELLTQRAALDGEIAGIAAAMRALGGRATTAATKRVRKAKPVRLARRVGRPAGRVGRPTGRVGRPAGRVQPGSLTDFVIRTLKASSRPLRAGDISSKVTSAGYKSGAKDLSKAVSNTLAKLKKVKRVGRGMYRL